MHVRGSVLKRENKWSVTAADENRFCGLSGNIVASKV